jgi:alpha-glucosidase
LPVGQDNLAHAVDVQKADPQSLLAFTRQCIALRKAHKALAVGIVSQCDADADFLLVERTIAGETLRCLFNFGKVPVAVPAYAQSGDVLMSVNAGQAHILPAFAAVVLSV